jgi:hypothetical protein
VVGKPWSAFSVLSQVNRSGADQNILGTRSHCGGSKRTTGCLREQKANGYQAVEAKEKQIQNAKNPWPKEREAQLEERREERERLRSRFFFYLGYQQLEGVGWGRGAVIAIAGE